jgi:FkbM family methyltransferase
MPAAPGRMFGATVRVLRACIRRLQSNHPSMGRVEKVLRGTLLVPVFGLLLVMLHLRARLAGPVEVLAVTRSGERFRCRPPDLVQMYLWLFGLWEPDLTTFIEDRLRDGDGFIDVGANIGYFSAVAARLVGARGAVVAIEASLAVFAALRETMELNGHHENVRCINRAAGDRVGTIAVYSGPSHNIGLTTTVPSRGFREEAIVDVLPLDQLLLPAEIRSARVVKIDVEGGEDRVLAGMQEFLDRCRSDVEILIELSPQWWTDSAHNPLDALKPFRDKGFQVYEMDNSYWPWRYLWPRTVRHPRRCQRDLTKRPRRLDIVLSRRDVEVLDSN